MPVVAGNMSCQIVDMALKLFFFFVFLLHTFLAAVHECHLSWYTCMYVWSVAGIAKSNAGIQLCMPCIAKFSPSL